MVASIEPELHQTPPRTLRRKRDFGCQNGCIQLFILPHTIVGIGMLTMALFSISVLIFGVRVPATITDVSFQRGSKGSITYEATYQYRYGNTEYTAKNQLSGNDYRLASKGQLASAKVSPLLPAQGSILYVPGGNPVGRSLLFLPIALFWNSILSLFYIMLYGSMIKEKSLVRNGIAVRGRVVEKEISRGKSTSYLVHYEYVPAPTVGIPEAIRAKMTVPQDEFHLLDVGDELTVLHDARKPKRSILYAPAAYAAQ